MNIRGFLVAGASLLAAALGILMLLRGVSDTPSLGPADGRDLAPTELERVAVGDIAPDFSLRALSGYVHTLSASRGHKNVVLVFYRGHW
jgi:hypothetical protein